MTSKRLNLGRQSPTTSQSKDIFGESLVVGVRGSENSVRKVVAERVVGGA